MRGGARIGDRYVLAVGLTLDPEMDLFTVTIETTGWDSGGIADEVMLNLARQKIDEELEVLRLRQELDG